MKRASRRVLVLRHERQYSNILKARFPTYFNAFRPVNSVRPNTDPTFYTPSYSRRIVSSSLRHASPASVSFSQTPSPFPIQTHSIPSANEPLHDALSELNNIAPDLVNQSRLQLALRGLESTSPTIRIAILGEGSKGLRKARRLARLLIADPLDHERAWERQLKDEKDGDNRAILLRYSELEEENRFSGVQRAPENPLLRSIAVRSPALGREKVELLVGQAHIAHGIFDEYGDREISEAALLPVLHSPLAGSGRAGSVRFPVHRSIMLGQGFRGAIALSEYADALGDDFEGPVHTAIDLPVSDKLLEGTSTNVAAAEDALDAFRMDVRNGPRFSETWQTSGMSHLSDLLKVHREGRRLPEPLLEHIRSVLSSTADTIVFTIRAARTDIESKTVPDTTRNALQAAITSWSEYAHSDLRDTMTIAFDSPTWRRTSFPRVLWRIDDVSFSASELLHSNFLIESETYLAFLTGRIGEAGFFADSQASSSSPPSPASPPPSAVASPSADIDPLQGLSPVQFLQLSETRDQVKAETGIDPFVTKPWPVGLTACRHALLNTLVPALHARAQSLVLQCLGLIGSTSALGAWYVVATAGSGMYEAGAIVGLGAVWALRRLQKLWGAERVKFEEEVREQGRVVLGEVEARLRGIVRDGRRPQIREEDQERWNKAEEIIGRCRELLKKL
ncbi:hypothetical protein C1H76_0933 [Elsinoe australis]|uniref:Mmc1 C-terminal domain-containing protein n=1 Tax=Elsinoe australis TaxID=40998 RepID=A0A4U7B6Y3_9PEZI|nr:hypothetical protein C1H76_0933 [Elsinoe australis]